MHSSGHTFLANLDFRKAIKGGKKNTEENIKEKWKYGQIGLELKGDRLTAYICINYLNSKKRRDLFRRFNPSLPKCDVINRF